MERMTGLDAGFLYMETPTLHMHTLKIADIASHQLDRRRPLWELWVVEGLEHGHIGVVAKIHHAAADGVAAAAMLANALGVGDTDDDEVDAWRPDPIPTDWELFVGAMKSLSVALAHLPQLLWRMFQGMFRLMQRRRAGGDLPPPPFSAPAVSFNRALTPHRRFVFSSIPLDDVKELKNALGATVNDIILALSAAALRRYLQDRGELPAR